MISAPHGGSRRYRRCAARRRRRALGWIAVALLWLGCHDSEPPPQVPATDEQPAAAPATPEVAARREPLPRSVAGISLGVSFADAQAKLGALTCHVNQAGYQVCNPGGEPGGVQHLELYLVHDRVVSVSYETPATANAFEALDQLIERYGHPSLSGLRERDKSGRLHEIYGWKDDDSLYSVRFMWHDVEAGSPELVGTIVALWDRKAYQQWEDETKPPPAATPGEPREPI